MIKITALIILAMLVAWAGLLLAKKRRLARRFRSLETSLFLIKMPRREAKKDTQREHEDTKNFVGAMEQVLSNLHSLKNSSWRENLLYGQQPIALELASDGKSISFYIDIPNSYISHLEKYIHGAYPDAEIVRVPEDYTIFEPGGAVAGASLRLKNDHFLPVKTYEELEVDPLQQIITTLSKLEMDEGATIQYLIKPASAGWLNKAERIVRELEKGKNFQEARQIARGGVLQWLKSAMDILSSNKDDKQGASQQSVRTDQTHLPIDQEKRQALLKKMQKPVFELNIRILASAPSRERAQGIVSQIIGAFGQLSWPGMNQFTHKDLHGSALKRFSFSYAFREFNTGISSIINTEELASVFHPPQPGLKLPKVVWVETAKVPPPDDLPEKGELLLGRASFRGEQKEIMFGSANDRRRHFYIIGQTGTGKTSFIANLIRQDIHAGRGVGVIDPHGDLVNTILSYINRERVEDVILFQPYDMDRPIGLNMLEYETEEQKDFAVQEMIAIFHKLFPPEIIGPMFEHYMRNAMLTLMADRKNPGTLVEIPRIFTDEKFIASRLKYVDDPLVRSFWEKEWRVTTGQTKSDMLGYVVSKVGRFVENAMMRNIIGQPHSGFSLDEIMDKGKIFLADLSKGKLGEVNAALLGLILVSKLQMAAMRRGKIAESQRRDFYLYIDEFQNFTTDSIATILSEARKYRLNLTIAHQFIAQLEETIRDAVFGNVGSLAAFRVGADDAGFLEKQFEPEFSQYDLINLNNFQAVMKFMIHGKVSSPFLFSTLPPPKGNSEIIEPLKRISRLKYGKDRADVETLISQRANLS